MPTVNCHRVSLGNTQGDRKPIVRQHSECDGTRAETRLRLSAKRTSPFKSAGALVQSTTGSRGVGISGSNGSNDGYTVFRGSVKGIGYPLHSPVSPYTSPPVRHRVPSRFNWTLLTTAAKCVCVCCIINIKLLLSYT
jgi:type 1 fimbria pilin